MKTHPAVKNVLFLVILFVYASFVNASSQKTIALTIDDLPFVGEARNFHLKMIIHTLKEQEIPAIGFIIAHEVKASNWEVLHQFRNTGLDLGNHTFSHANLNKLSVKEYIQEIKKADKLLAEVMTEPKYFRYPYLAMSSGTKKNSILCYLAKNNYQVAPITIDSKDFIFNQRLFSVPEMERRAYLTELKTAYLDYIWKQTLKAEQHSLYHHQPEQAQILLIHANLLNAYVLPDIISLYKEKGYTFVSLENALKTFKKVDKCPGYSVASPLLKTALPNTKKSAPIESIPIEDFMDWD